MKSSSGIVTRVLDVGMADGPSEGLSALHLVLDKRSPEGVNLPVPGAWWNLLGLIQHVDSSDGVCGIVA